MRIAIESHGDFHHRLRRAAAWRVASRGGTAAGDRRRSGDRSAARVSRARRSSSRRIAARSNHSAGIRIDASRVGIDSARQRIAARQPRGIAIIGSGIRHGSFRRRNRRSLGIDVAAGIDSGGRFRRAHPRRRVLWIHTTKRGTPLGPRLQWRGVGPRRQLRHRRLSFGSHPGQSRSARLIDARHRRRSNRLAIARHGTHAGTIQIGPRQSGRVGSGNIPPRRFHPPRQIHLRSIERLQVIATRNRAVLGHLRHIQIGVG